MSVESQKDLEALRAIGRIVARTLHALAQQVRPGVTTAELDHNGAALLALHGARAAPPLIYNFPGALCISVNDEAIHGVPGDRTIQSGDLVKLDLVAEKDGYFADAAVTVEVAPVTAEATSLARCAQQAFHSAMSVARAGNRIREIGRSVEREVKRSGFRVIRELAGHGVGRSIHEAPTVPNFADSHERGMLTEGLVITVEPIIAAGGARIALQPDGWTMRTEDGGLSAHFEHTIVITKNEPILLTVM